MKKASKIKRVFSVILCIFLITSMAIITAGCGGNEEKPKEENTTSSKTNEVTVLGQGSTKFFFDATDLDGKTSSFEIYTDEDFLGKALTEVEMISGDEGDYGLYVNTVNGILADAEKGEYWILYVGGESSMTGVDQVKIEDGEKYEFKIEKF